LTFLSYSVLGITMFFTLKHLQCNQTKKKESFGGNMKRFCVLAILLFVFLLNLVAQNIVIGESEYSWGFPFRPGFEHWRSASLYTSDEIGHHGTITHLSWRAEDGTFSDPCPLFFPIKIYAKMVEGEVLFPQRWSDLVSGADLLYEGEFPFIGNGWNIIDIDDYYYSHDNLMILCETNLLLEDGAYQWPEFQQSNEQNKHLQGYVSEENMTTTSVRPLIRLSFMSDDDIGATQIGSPIDGWLEMPILPSLHWRTGPGLAPPTYEVYLDTNNPPTTKIAETTDAYYVVENELDYETVYYWQIVPVDYCNEPFPKDECPVGSFTTRPPIVRPVPFYEDFERMERFPIDWEYNLFDVYTRYGDDSVTAYHYIHDNVTDCSFTTCLIGPLPEFTTLEFDYRYIKAPYEIQDIAFELGEGNKIDILISTDGGETFETYYTIDHTNHTTLNSFDRFTVPVVGYGGEIVKFKFLATWSSGSYYLSFDNIGVQEAASEPSFRINPFEKEYGLYHIPLTSEDQLYTISNVGVAPLTVSAVALTGQDPEEFVLTDDNNYPVTLAFGESISFNVKYLPLTDGEKSADLFVSYDDGSAKDYSVPLSGSAYTSLISTFPFYESFEEGNSSNSYEINNWTQAYEPSSPYQRFWSASENSSLYYTGPRTGDFSIILQKQAATWLFRPIVLEAGKSYYFELYARQDTYTGATIKVAYGKSATPSAMTNTIINTSTVKSVLYWDYSGAFTAEESGLHFIGILGTTTVAPQFLTIDDISINKLSDDPEFVISETEIAFDPTGVGETSMLRTFTVGNDSGGEIVIDSAQLSGENTDQFDFADNNTYPIKLKAFQKATFRLFYKPTNSGNHTAKLTINYNDGADKSADVNLSGKGISPIVEDFPYIETFDTYLPAFWTEKRGLLADTTSFADDNSNWYQTSWFASIPYHENGDGAAANIYGSSTIEWLISPSLDLGNHVPGGYKLEFDLALTNYNPSFLPSPDGFDDKFAVVISTDNGENWSAANILRLWDNQGSEYVLNDISNTGERVIIDLIGYSGLVKIGFYVESTVDNANNELHIDNFTITYDATLPVELSAFNAVILKNNTVSINWETQSENSLLGYYIHRSDDDEVENAIRINTTIVQPVNSNSVANYSYNDQEVVLDNTYYYWLQSVEMNGTYEMHGPIVVTVNQNDNNTPGIVYETAFRSVFPNPFNPTTTLSFSLAEKGDVNIKIFNVKGQLVKEIKKPALNKGVHNIVWNGKDSHNRDCATGIYLFRLQTESKTMMKKGMLVK